MKTKDEFIQTFFNGSPLSNEGQANFQKGHPIVFDRKPFTIEEHIEFNQYIKNGDHIFLECESGDKIKSQVDNIRFREFTGYYELHCTIGAL